MALNIKVSSSDWIDLRTRGYTSGMYLLNAVGAAIEYSTAAQPVPGTTLVGSSAVLISGAYLWVRGSGDCELYTASEWAAANVKTEPLLVSTSSSGEIGKILPEGLTVIPKYRKFPGFTACIAASLVAGATYGQAGTLVTVSATGHGMTAALNGRAIYWPGSAAIPAGFYPGYQYVDANTFTFTNPTSQTVAAGSALTPTLPFTSPVKIASRTIYGGAISATGKIELDFTSVADNSAGLKSLQVKLGGAQCGLSQVGSTPNTSGRISICADGSTSKQIATGGVDGNVSSATYQTTIDTTVDQTLEVFLQMSGASQFRSVISLLAREVA